jgi:hypothetical protein
MSHFDTVARLAQERQQDALREARNRARARQAQDPFLNHYHFWPEARIDRQQEARLEAERAWQLARRPQAGSWLARLAAALRRGPAVSASRDGNPDLGATAARVARRA